MPASHPNAKQRIRALAAAVLVAGFAPGTPSIAEPPGETKPPREIDAAPAPKDDAPDSLAPILEFPGERPHARRIDDIRALGDSLSSRQVERLVAFVRAPTPEGLGAPRALHAEKNEILNLLRRQTAHLEALRDQLLALSRDADADPVIRDYALQHLASLALDRDAAEDRRDFEAHVDILDGENPALAATAMIHLLVAQQRDRLEAVSRAQLATAARRMAADPDAPASSRATALQVVARLGLDDQAPLARELAEDPAQPIPLRIAAIAALGDLAPDDPRTRNFLEKTAEGPERRLRLPAQSALNKRKPNP